MNLKAKLDWACEVLNGVRWQGYDCWESDVELRSVYSEILSLSAFEAIAVALAIHDDRISRDVKSVRAKWAVGMLNNHAYNGGDWSIDSFGNSLVVVGSSVNGPFSLDEAVAIAQWLFRRDMLEGLRDSAKWTNESEDQSCPKGEPTK